MLTRIIAISMFLAACSSATPAPDAASGQPSTEHGSPTQPDAKKLARHLREHVTYPATRADILATCASTPEFTDSEKQWTRTHLPEARYTNADQVIDVFGI